MQGWNLPSAFAEMRRLLEVRSGRAGKREYIQILRLTEIAPPAVVGGAVSEAIRRGVIGFDAVKQLLVARIEGRPARLDPRAYPWLPTANVKTTSAADYAAPTNGRSLATALVMARFASGLHQRCDWPEIPPPYWPGIPPPLTLVWHPNRSRGVPHVEA